MVNSGKSVSYTVTGRRKQVFIRLCVCYLPVYKSASVNVCFHFEMVCFEQTTGRTAVLIKLRPRYYDAEQNGVFVKRFIY